MSTEGRILVSHVGSLIRPPELAKALRTRYHARLEGETYADEQGYQELLSSSVVDVVRKQVAAGVDIVSDGEFGKDVSWAGYARERLGGFERRPFGPDAPGSMEADADRRRFPEFYEEDAREMAATVEDHLGAGRVVATAPITYTGQEEIGRDIRNLKAAMASAGALDGFLPVAAVPSAAFGLENEHYESDHEFHMALARALNEEYRAIVDAGLIVQLDDAFLAFMHSMMAPDFDGYRRWAESMIEPIVASLDGIPIERSRYHVCWGSWNGPHTFDVALEDIVDLIVQIPVGAYAIEQANPRHEHEWHVWERVELPAERKLMPGVVTHSTNVVEHPELVAERLARLADIVGPDRVIAGTDCGFAQAPTIRRTHETVQWAKLETLAEGAALASRRLAAA